MNLLPNFQKGGGGNLQDLIFKRGVGEKKGVIFARWGGGRGGAGCNFYKKNKIKSEIFNDKKSKNSHWEILTLRI